MPIFRLDQKIDLSSRKKQILNLKSIWRIGLKTVQQWLSKMSYYGLVDKQVQQMKERTIFPDLFGVDSEGKSRYC